MALAIILLILRVVSAVLLMLVLGVLFFVLWRDYRGAANEVQAARRVYGQLVGLYEVDGEYAASGEIYPLLPLTSMGRAPTNTIRLDDQFASSEHATVILRDGVWWLEDRQSRNGTNLNGIPVAQPVIITDGDIVNIGSTHLRMRLE